MNVLAIDTSGPVAGCAVLADGRVAHLVAMNHGLTHSETIMPAVDAALSASGLACGDIDVFAAVERGEIAQERYDSYRQMYEEVKGLKDYQITGNRQQATGNRQ